ncbi:hypothetical protein AB4Y95_02520 [Arthrobacter sp. M-10]|uniref:hypothetical protein n=1 Tax=Arthrobacter sp. M-10 TaxID=3233037 RepID=UPI003F8F6622
MSTMSKITIKVEDRASRDHQLERTSDLLRRDASDCGILVTRVDHATFEVALSSDVPFGLTLELDLL